MTSFARRVRGSCSEVLLLEAPPHPDPLPASGEREKRPEGFNVRRLIVAAALVLFSAFSAAAQTAPRLPDPPAAIEIKARPIDAFDPRDTSRHRFGALEFRGGLELTSPHKRFGGLSALRVMADGAHFLSLTDRGWWLHGRIVYDGARPIGIADAEIAPMLAADGRTLAQLGWYDTEALTDDGGTAYVGIERVNRIVRFDVGKFGLLARAVPVATPLGIGKLPYNLGLECLAFVPKGLPGAGTLIAIVGTRSRCGRQSQGIPDRRADARRVFDCAP